MSAVDPFVGAPARVDDVEIIIVASDLGVTSRVNYKIRAGNTVLSVRVDDLTPDLTPAQLNYATKLGEDMLAKARGIL